MHVVVMPFRRAAWVIRRSLSGSVMPWLARPSVRRRIRLTPSTVLDSTWCRPLSHPPDKFVVPPGGIDWMARITCAMASGWQAPGSAMVSAMVMTSSSNATTEIRSWGPRYWTNCAAASLAAWSGSPFMEPERSSTKAVLMGARWVGLSPLRPTTSLIWWACWAVTNSVDRLRSACMGPPRRCLVEEEG